MQYLVEGCVAIIQNVLLRCYEEVTPPWMSVHRGVVNERNLTYNYWWKMAIGFGSNGK